ncbi:MAG TPA: hypothetical protein VE403_01990 [Sphingomicrobium sp.]|nr:hypothetical protein [Sphingomicrobium sp.]
MTAGQWLLGLAPALAATAAFATQPASDGASQAAQKIAACEGEKFEFAAGEPRPTRITLCSDKGATTEGLVRMLESAAGKIEQLDKLSPDRRAALVAQVKAKIIDVRARNSFVSLPATVLPPEIGPKPEYAQLPPLPPPVPLAVAAKPSAAPPLILSKPRLTLTCTRPIEMRDDGPCTTFATDTLLTIRADETLPAGTSLRFLRKGDQRAEVALPPMRAGQSRRISLPMELCSRVVRTSIEIHVVRSAGTSSLAQVVDRHGPYPLRC